MLIARDVQSHKVPALTLRRLELDLGGLLKKVKSVVSSLLEGASHKGIVILVTLIGLQSVIKAASYGDLSRYIDVEASGLMNVGDVLDEIGRSDGPTDFPASAVHHLASGEHSDRFLVVVANSFL